MNTNLYFSELRLRTTTLHNSNLSRNLLPKKSPAHDSCVILLQEVVCLQYFTHVKQLDNVALMRSSVQPVFLNCNFQPPLPPPSNTHTQSPSHVFATLPPPKDRRFTKVVHLFMLNRAWYYGTNTFLGTVSIPKLHTHTHTYTKSITLPLPPPLFPVWDAYYTLSTLNRAWYCGISTFLGTVSMPKLQLSTTPPPQKKTHTCTHTHTHTHKVHRTSLSFYPPPPGWDAVYYTLSILNRAWYCGTSAFLGTVNIFMSAFSSNECSATTTGRRPTNSGIIPKSIKSLASTSLRSLSRSALSSFTSDL